MPRLDLSRVLQATKTEPEPIPSALMARCASELPLPPEMQRDQSIAAPALLSLSVLWASEYHYCRGRHDVLVDYLIERQGG